MSAKSFEMYLPEYLDTEAYIFSRQDRQKEKNRKEKKYKKKNPKVTISFSFEYDILCEYI